MRRLPFALLVAATCAAISACGRPTEDDCRKAVLNVQKIRLGDGSSNAPDPEPAVRKCTSTGSRDQVACLIAAKSTADVDACAAK